MTQWRLIKIWGGCLAVGLLIGAASVRGGKPQSAEPVGVVSTEPNVLPAREARAPRTSAETDAAPPAVIPASYVAAVDSVEVVALAAVDEATRTLLEPRLRVPVRIELPAFPFVTEPQPSRPTASDVLSLQPLPTAEAVTSNVPRELPNERRLQRQHRLRVVQTPVHHALGAASAHWAGQLRQVLVASAPSRA